MTKAVLISIRPEWVERILSGQKTLEVRKNRPKLETPFKVYIYCTAGNLSYEVGNGMFCNISGGKLVVGEFVCDTFVTDKTLGHDEMFNAAACVSEREATAYSAGKPVYGWHISDLKIYDVPRELENFRRACQNDWYCESCAMHSEHNGTCGNESLHLRRPPQSWCYVEELKND